MFKISIITCLLWLKNEPRVSSHFTLSMVQAALNYRCGDPISEMDRSEYGQLAVKVVHV